MPNINRRRWRRKSVPRRYGWLSVHQTETSADGTTLVRAIRRMPDGSWWVRVNVLRDQPDGTFLVHDRDFAVPHLHRTAL